MQVPRVEDVQRSREATAKKQKSRRIAKALKGASSPEQVKLATSLIVNPEKSLRYHVKKAGLKATPDGNDFSRLMCEVLDAVGATMDECANKLLECLDAQRSTVVVGRDGKPILVPAGPDYPIIIKTIDMIMRLRDAYPEKKIALNKTTKSTHTTDIGDNSLAWFRERKDQIDANRIPDAEFSEVVDGVKE